MTCCPPHVLCCLPQTTRGFPQKLRCSPRQLRCSLRTVRGLPGMTRCLPRMSRCPPRMTRCSPRTACCPSKGHSWPPRRLRRSYRASRELRCSKRASRALSFATRCYWLGHWCLVIGLCLATRGLPPVACIAGYSLPATGYFFFSSLFTRYSSLITHCFLRVFLSLWPVFLLSYFVIRTS